MADAVGGCGTVTGDERQEDWKCPGCGQVHGYIRIPPDIIAELHITAFGAEFVWIGDGWYHCPACGNKITWRAGLRTYKKLMSHYGATR